MNWKNGFRKKGTSMKTIDIRLKEKVMLKPIE